MLLVCGRFGDDWRRPIWKKNISVDSYQSFTVDVRMILKYGRIKVFLVFRIQSFLKIHSLVSEINSWHLSLLQRDYNYFQIKTL